ncbi:MAG: RNA-binding transcriptional accessory protein, partial [Phaeodactylibacter sp.]|nr:RNA-binding transcriptional accessory protein [Phaeodactylibacter sp.]
MEAKHVQLITDQLNLPYKRVENVLQLLADGATIPFIARYRKEVTGSMDEVQIADIQQNNQKLQEIEKRKGTILKAIEEQGKLTDALKNRIEGSYDLNELEDIYLPY